MQYPIYSEDKLNADDVKAISDSYDAIQAKFLTISDIAVLTSLQIIPCINITKQLGCGCSIFSIWEIYPTGNWSLHLIAIEQMLNFAWLM